MAYAQAILQRARARYEQAKTARAQEYEEHLQQAYMEYPRLREIDRELRLTMVQLVANSLRQGEDLSVAISEVREQNLALQREREWIIDAAEYPEGFLDDSPICKRCSGTGYFGASMCSCLRELCRQEQKRELTSLLGNGRESFDSFRLDYYSDEYDPKLGTSPRKLMQSNFNICKRYAQTFSPASGNLLFSGATGLGKTFLSACIARQVSDLGFSVMYETATRVFQDFEAEKFGSEENIGKSQKYFDCDLLIIDDLGTEMITQFTISALYTIVNSRMMDGKPTIISTNLLPEAIEKKYSPQIASRIVGTYRLIKFVGNDIRRL
ncbi:MAG: DNA replication protein DnaC [Ruminococcaceae bacterium]|nr:DNA replication protein DnaC [Oscillospiraceae bacterium]